MGDRRVALPLQHDTQSTATARGTDDGATRELYPTKHSAPKMQVTLTESYTWAELGGGDPARGFDLLYLRHTQPGSGEQTDSTYSRCAFSPTPDALQAPASRRHLP